MGVDAGDFDGDRRDRRSIVFGVCRRIDLLQANAGVRIVIVVASRDGRVVDFVGKHTRTAGRDHERPEQVELLAADRQLTVGVRKAVERR